MHVLVTTFALVFTASRRCACGLAAASIFSATPLPLLAAPDSPSVIRLRKGLSDLDAMISNWSEITIDCSYGEIQRQLLESSQKQQLLEAASSTSKGATMVTMCKSSARAVRRGLGTTEEGPLTKVSVVLKQPELLDALQSDADFERFQATSERLQQALSAADAAAFYSASGDFSAQVPPRPVCIARVLPNIAHAPHSFCADDIQARRDAQHA